MDKYERAKMLGKHIIETKETVRQIARQYGFAKTTVHNDLADRLREINSPLYEEAAAVLEEHRQVRHIRGGEATKAKYDTIRREVLA